MKLLKKLLKSEQINATSATSSPQRSTTNLDLDTSDNVAYAARVNNLP